MQVYFVLYSPVAAPESSQHPALQTGPKIADFFSSLDLAEVYRPVGQFIQYGLFILLSLQGEGLWRVRAAVVPMTANSFDLPDFSPEQGPIVVSNTHLLQLLWCCLTAPIQL
jgi:hypothetical protein